MWTAHVVLIHSQVDGHLGRVHLRALMSNAAVDVHVQVFMWTSVFNSLEEILRRGNCGSSDKVVFLSLINHAVVFPAFIRLFSWTLSPRGCSV